MAQSEPATTQLCGVLEPDAHGGERHVFLVTELGVGFGLALAVQDRRRLGIADSQRFPECLLLRRVEAGVSQDRVDGPGYLCSIGIGEPKVFGQCGHQRIQTVGQFDHPLVRPHDHQSLLSDLPAQP